MITPVHVTYAEPSGFEAVTYLGEIVTYNGEIVYVNMNLPGAPNGPVNPRWSIFTPTNSPIVFTER
jgi:hypothetical protein